MNLDPTQADHLEERPRERMWRTGSDGIGDEELLALIIGTGSARQSARALANQLLHATGGLASLSRASPRELAQITGVGAALSARLVAAFELGRRAVDLTQHREVLGHAEDVFRCVAPRLAGVAQEVFLTIGVDIRNRLLDVVEVARGSVSAVEVHPREVFRPLIRMAAAGGVIVHNHPSGDPTPSGDDLALTRRLREVGALLGIPIIDHVVIGDRSFRSIAEWLGAEL
ncbi:MAG: DNA repair protein RadC [Kofleriaceae bacterium]